MTENREAFIITCVNRRFNYTKRVFLDIFNVFIFPDFMNIKLKLSASAAKTVPRFQTKRRVETPTHESRTKCRMSDAGRSGCEVDNLQQW